MYQNPYQNPYYNQFNQPNNAFQQNTQTLIRVNGIEGAKAYQMSANSTVALFDGSEDLMYIKQTDGAGFGSIRTFKFEELHNLCKNTDYVAENKQFITRQEMEDYVKHIIQSTKTDAEVQSAAD